MHHYKITFFFFLFSFCVKAQTNLVPNPSFEIYTVCPTSQNQVSNAIGWDIYRANCDYYNACASYSTTVSVPWNGNACCGLSYQYAASGNAYMGFYTDFPITSIDYREIIGCQLAFPLTIGTKYYVSLKANLTFIDSSQGINTATDHLGTLFSTVPYSVSAPAPINNHSQVYGTTIITDTMNWTKIFGSFVADSSYKYISIGNFFDSAHTNRTIFYHYNNNEYFAYYFIDDICVSTDSIYTANWQWVGIKENRQPFNISVFPNPTNLYLEINLDYYNEPYAISIMDLLGNEKLGTETMGSKTTINTSELQNGIYILKVKDKTKEYMQKVSVNH